MSHSVSKCNSLSTTAILLPRPSPNHQARPRLNRADTHPRQMTCPRITRLTTRGMLIRITITETTANPRNRIRKIRPRLSREEEAHLSALLQSRALSILQAELNPNHQTVTGKPQRLRPAATRLRIPHWRVNNSRISHTKCFSSKLKVRLEASITLMGIHTTIRASTIRT